jgi:hypothetical protein
MLEWTLFLLFKNIEYIKYIINKKHPAFGSSAFGIVITQRVDNQIQIMHAEEY